MFNDSGNLDKRGCGCMERVGNASPLSNRLDRVSRDWAEHWGRAYLCWAIASTNWCSLEFTVEFTVKYTDTNANTRAQTLDRCMIFAECSIVLILITWSTISMNSRKNLSKCKNSQTNPHSDMIMLFFFYFFSEFVCIIWCK